MANCFSIFEAAAQCPGKIGLRRAGEDYSFARLATLTQNTIDRLHKEKVLPEKGRPMVVEGKNTVETIVLLYALFELKVPALMLHPKLTAAERYVLLSSIREIQDPLPEDTVAVLFTSGTTGLPKPAIITRKMLWESAKASEVNLGWQEGDCWQLCMSVTRIGGLSILTRCLLARKTLAISPLFSPESFTQALIDDQVTITSIVPTMLAKVFETYPDWRAPEALRVILLGGSSANDKLLEKAHRQGLPIVTTYGMTETLSHIALRKINGEDASLYYKPFDTVKISVDENNALIIEAPAVSDIILHTNDIVDLKEDGSFRIIGRKDNIINTCII